MYVLSHNNGSPYHINYAFNLQGFSVGIFFNNVTKFLLFENTEKNVQIKV